MLRIPIEPIWKKFNISDNFLPERQSYFEFTKPDEMLGHIYVLLDYTQEADYKNVQSIIDSFHDITVKQIHKTEIPSINNLKLVFLDNVEMEYSYRQRLLTIHRLNLPVQIIGWNMFILS